jgi:hypothetical protein
MRINRDMQTSQTPPNKKNYCYYILIIGDRRHKASNHVKIGGNEQTC